MKKPNVSPGFIIGVCVLIIVGYIIIKLVQFCQEHFAPADPPDMPTPNASNVVNGVEAALFLQPVANPQLGALTSAAAETPQDTGCYFSFQILMTDLGPYLANCSVPGLYTVEQFGVELAEYGLSLDKPAHPADIQWDGQALTVHSGAMRVVIERSLDMRQWTAVATNNYPPDLIPWVTLPAPCGTNAFWRVRQ